MGFLIAGNRGRCTRFAVAQTFGGDSVPCFRVTCDRITSSSTPVQMPSGLSGLWRSITPIGVSDVQNWLMESAEYKSLFEVKVAWSPSPTRFGVTCLNLRSRPGSLLVGPVGKTGIPRVLVGRSGTNSSAGKSSLAYWKQERLALSTVRATTMYVHAAHSTIRHRGQLGSNCVFLSSRIFRAGRTGKGSSALN